MGQNIKGEINDGVKEAFECYSQRKEKLGITKAGKGIMDLIREDPVLSKKITFEEAVLMNPSILENFENGEEILKEIREKYPQPDIDELDDGVKEAVECYLQTIGIIEEKNEKAVSKSKTLNM